MSEKTCNHCKVAQPLTGFTKSVRAADGLSPRCRRCVSLQNVTDKPRQYRRAYRASDKGGFSKHKRSARVRGIESELTLIDYVRLRQTKTCPFCGCVLLVGAAQVKGSPHPGSFSLDRIDNARGYVVGNVRAVCFLCNGTKGRHTPETWAACVNGITRSFLEVLACLGSPANLPPND